MSKMNYRDLISVNITSQQLTLGYYQYNQMLHSWLIGLQIINDFNTKIIISSTKLSGDID